VRIGVLISDEATLVFGPTPLLIESESSEYPRPNAIRFNASANKAETSVLLQREAEDLAQGSEAVVTAHIESVARNLAANPPLKFDLAQKVRVFNARFEFVEFELTGLAISRKRVSISSDLMGLAKDKKTQNLLHSTFNLIAADSELSGESISNLKKRIADKYLVVLQGYGTVVLRTYKARFERAVRALRRCVTQFQKQVIERLQAEMDANRETLVETLFPLVVASPPGRWNKFLGQQPSPAILRRHLAAELGQAFGTAEKVIGEMKVTAIFKGVTYESLSDPAFIDVVTKKIPSLEVLHEEYEATKASTTHEHHPGNRS